MIGDERETGKGKGRVTDRFCDGDVMGMSKNQANQGEGQDTSKRCGRPRDWQEMRDSGRQTSDGASKRQASVGKSNRQASDLEATETSDGEEQETGT